MRIAAVLLAAGLGSRFDPTGESDKLLAPWLDGKPVLWHSASRVLAAVDEVIAVIRPGQDQRRECLERLGIRVVSSGAARLGMGAALSDGIAALAGADGALVCLGDMPAVSGQTLIRVRDAITDARAIVAPRFNGTPGHPVGFGAHWFDELRALDADRGPRHLLTRHEVSWLTVDDPGCRLDVDHPADLAMQASAINPRRV